jgi:hypothetical protein
VNSLKPLIDRLENSYDFQCEAGPLKNCVEWQQLKALLAALEREAFEANRTILVLTHESRSPDGDGQREVSTPSGELSDNASGTLAPPQGHVHARDGNSGVRVASFASQRNASAGSEPADSLSLLTCAFCRHTAPPPLLCNDEQTVASGTLRT